MDASGQARQAAPDRRTGSDPAAWLARLAVSAVFAINVECAFSFVFLPERFARGFELSGLPGAAAVRGLGIAFLMWNATYPLVIWRPRRHRAIFGVVLAQQAIGLAGESWLLATLPAGHEALATSIERFIVFDGAGLVLMVVAFAALTTTGTRRPRSEERP